MDRNEIMTFLPHRPPMLLVDEADFCTESGTAWGRYTVDGGEWFLQGHFPGNPVVPGVILCEIMAQSCCLLMKDELTNKTPYFTGINSIRFRRVVRPGDTVETVSRIVRRSGPYFIAECAAKAGGEPVADAKLSFMLAAADH